MATFDPMSWPDENIFPSSAEDHDPHLVVGLGVRERLVELDEQTRGSGRSGVGAVRA